jgi:hypothetical protein
MNPQSPYVDANYYYADVARPFDTHSVSASPSSNYVQEPMQNKFHVSTSYNFRNLQHVNSNYRASSTPEIHMPMNNMVSLINQYETHDTRNSNSIHESVSHVYSSTNNSQYVGSPSNMPMDREIGHATTSYLANYPQPSYAIYHANNFSPPYATRDIHNSAPHHHNGYSRIDGNSIGANVVSLSTTIAYSTSPAQL